MKFNARTNESKDEMAAYIEWLRVETTSSLKKSYGDRESVDAAMFLFANRAFESHLAEDLIWRVAGEAIGQAGYSQDETELVLDMLEAHATLAAQVHSDA